jgi:hypothetical protein
MNKLISDFNNIVYRIITATQKVLPSDADLYRIRQRLEVGIGTKRSIVIDKAGPAIWKYRERIEAEDETYFLSNPLNDVQSMDKEIPFLMEKIKNMWRGLNEDEKKEFYGLTNQLVGIYAEYLLCVRAQ